MSFLQARPTATHDFYGPIHKALRLAHTQMLTRLGACGGEDAGELELLLADLMVLLEMAEHHLENEDRWVHTALEARAPGSTRRLEEAHAQHHQTFAELQALVGEVQHAVAGDQGRLMRHLYLRFTRFVADDFAHMADEEELILPVLQGLFTDEELRDLEHQIVSALAPEQVIAMGRFMIPAATREDRVALLSGIRANAPAPAFTAIMDHAAQPFLPRGDYLKLCAALQVEPNAPRPADGIMRWGRIPS